MLDDVENDATARVEDILKDPSMAGYDYVISNAHLTDQPYEYDWLSIK